MPRHRPHPLSGRAARPGNGQDPGACRDDGGKAGHRHAPYQGALAPGHAGRVRRGVRKRWCLSGRGVRLWRAPSRHARVFRRARAAAQGAGRGAPQGLRAPRMLSGPDALNMPNTDEGFLGLFTRHAASQPDRTFARIGARALTFGQLESSVAGLVAWLRHQGVGSGDRVALMLRNGEAALSLMLAVAYAGAIWVPVHTGAVGDNLAYVLGHAEPRIVVAEPDLLPAIAACGARPNWLAIAPAQILTRISLQASPQTSPQTSPGNLPAAGAMQRSASGALADSAPAADQPFA